MEIIVCVDDRFGMAFNQRRQSRDRVLNQKIISLLGERHLMISPYSFNLFKEYSEQLIITDDYLKIASSGDVCFVERDDLSPYIMKIEKIYLVKWNRTYPADLYLNLDLTTYHLIQTEEFQGSSHDNITIEIYVLKEN